MSFSHVDPLFQPDTLEEDENFNEIFGPGPGPGRPPDTDFEEEEEGDGSGVEEFIEEELDNDEEE